MSIEIHFEGERPIILEDGEAVSAERGAFLAQALAQAYQMPRYVYIAYSPTLDAYKVGHSEHPDRRAKALKAQLIHQIQCPNLRHTKQLQRVVAQAFAEHGTEVADEWFALAPGDVEMLIQQHAQHA
ncbi:MAG: GIY-YIG nuclease family protein [Chloroflexi bacterium]|nr:GIY-YIG nuclease family protein [Chloroflexota bacterium]